MRHTASAAALVMLIAFGVAGCGTKERDELRAKVGTLEQQLAQATKDNASKEAELTAVRGQLQRAQEALSQSQAQAERLSHDLEQTLAELVKTKSELAKKNGGGAAGGGGGGGGAGPGPGGRGGH